MRRERSGRGRQQRMEERLIDHIPPTATTSALGKAGEVHLSFVTSYDPAHSFLAPFNLHRQVLGVLGLSSLSSLTNMNDLEYSPTALRQLHPGAVVHRVFVFDTGAARPQTVDLSSMRNAADLIEAAGQSESGTASSSGFSGRGTSGLVVFPAVRKDFKDVKFYLKTLLPDFVGTLLDGLDTTVKGLQGKPLETPRETLDGYMTSPSPQSSTATGKFGGTAVTSPVGSAASRASALFSSFSADEKKSSRNSKSSSSLSNTGPLGAGRFGKVKADYYLLAGDLWKALNTYDSCMNLLGREKAMLGSQDAVWYASALEGWAVARYLVARMGGSVEERASCLTLPLGGTKEKEKDKDKEKSDFQFHSKAWSDIAEAYSIALTIYAKCLAPTSYLLESGKSITPDTPRDYTHPLIHTSACLAYSRLLLAIWASGGWNAETFDQLLYGGVPPALAETRRPTRAVYAQHCTASGVQQSDIAAPASLAVTNSSMNGLKILDQMYLLASLAALFGAIGFTRREAYVIRRLQVLVVSLIASGIAVQKREPSSTNEFIRSTAGSAEAQAYGTMTSMITAVGAGQDADSILVLALQICQSYGIDVERGLLRGLHPSHILSRAAVDVKSGRHLSSPHLSRERADWSQGMTSIEETDWQRQQQEQEPFDAALKKPPHFGWISQQVAILKDALSICEMLQDEESMVFFAVLLLRDFWPYLSMEDQRKLKNGIGLVQRSLQAKGSDIIMECWAPTNLLDDMRLVSSGSDINLRPVPPTGGPAIDSSSSRKKHSSRTDVSVPVQTNQLFDGALVSFEVTFLNSLSIPLDIETVKLDVTMAGSIGPKFEATTSQNIVIPPLTHKTIQLNGKPHGEGKLLLRGVTLKLPNCTPRSIAFERTDGENATYLARLQGEFDDACTRTKYSGMEARQKAHLDVTTSKPQVRAEDRFMLLHVIPTPPRLLVETPSLMRSGTLVLFDGEKVTVELRLQNRSKVDIDFVRFEFEDDLQSVLLNLLADGHLNPVHVHELEKDVLQMPFLEAVDEPVYNDAGIPAGKSKTFRFLARGKIDVRRAKIKIEYGHLRAARELGRDQFWTRRAECRFDVRVLPMLTIDELEATEVHKDNVLLGMRLRNLHTSSVGVRWQMSETILNRQLAANSTVHVYVEVPRLALSEEAQRRPIPSLMERQFILSKSGNRTERESQMILKHFWARQALLDLIHTRSWINDRTGKEGEISTNGLHIADDRTLSMLCQSTLTLEIDMDEKIDKCTFVQWKVTSRNTSDNSSLVRGRYRVIPQVPERLVNQIQCTNGCLYGPLVQDSSSTNGLGAGQTSEISIGLCFLASGTYPFLVKVFDQDDGQLLVDKRVTVHVQ